MGLNVYTDYKYPTDEWHYHEKMISSIRTKEYDKGGKALMDQSDMLLELLDRHPGKQQEFKG